MRFGNFLNLSKSSHKKREGEKKMNGHLIIYDQR